MPRKPEQIADLSSEKKVTVSLPAATYNAVLSAAQADRRSFGSELVVLLTEALAARARK